MNQNNKEFIIDKRNDKRLLRDYLRFELGCSGKVITELKKSETGILLNGNRVTVRAVLHEGDILSLKIGDADDSENIIPVELPLDIVYEDQDILALNKPYGMPTHPSHNHFDDTLANGVMFYYKKKNYPFVFRAVNRLDRDTSGLVLISKNKLSASKLSSELKERRIKKKYTAIVLGDPGECGIIDVPIKRKNESIIERVVSDDGQEAVTCFKRIAKGDGFSVVSVEPKTGRTHQIRVHMAYIGCPILGDTLYGPEDGSKLISRQALHCREMSFLHPSKNELLTVSAPLPQDMMRLAYEADVAYAAGIADTADR
mgnify:CR=1 FL=1